MTACVHCSGSVPPHTKDCPVCGRFAGFPNIRAAQTEVEHSALIARLAISRNLAIANGSTSELQEFSKDVLASVIVMNRHLGPLHTWVNGNSPIFSSFFQQVEAGRLPEESTWDRQRASAESTIHPNYYKDIVPAALSLDNYGMPYYGPYSLVLKEEIVGHRASVFEENPFVFNKRHTVISGVDPPAGYRATWGERNLLAEAKLGHKIVCGMQHSDFISVLIEPKRGDSDCDFIEVHIYGSIHNASIARAAGPEPTRQADRILWRQTLRKLKELGAVTEVVEWKS